MTEDRPKAKPDINRMIEAADALIADVIKIDPIAATLLGLAKSELLTCKAVDDGQVLRFSLIRTRAH